jgi:hypothetical protein
MSESWHSRGVSSSEVSIYATAHASEEAARDVAVDLMSYVCESGLRLDDYEPVLHSLATGLSP